jgi:chemotaxis protein methyltransferase WspC
MNPLDFEALLKQTIGLDAASIGSSAVDRAVQERMTACRIASSAEYWEQVNGSADELQELVEAVVVPETWFFRDREAFPALTRVAFEEWLRVHPEGTMRLASLPCSTGEEPFSMAMALLDAGFPAERFRVDAVDISQRALAVAQRGVYGRNSFRGGDLAFRDRHFEVAGRGWELRAPVRAQVRFDTGNVLNPDLLAGSGPYDVIFCRNVLIYFDRATQDRAVAVLAGLLSAKGFLFVGPSETGLMLAHNFDSARMPLAFAFRKPGAVPPPPPAVNPVTARRRPLAPPPVSWAAAVARVAPRATVTASPVVTTPAPTVAASLDEIARLADEGHLAEAARRCEEHVRSQGPSARAFYLLGLVRDAAGQHVEAAQFYRKALYLQPDHHETLVHLAHLLEQQGDAAGAKVLHARAQRTAPKPKT